MTVLIEKSWDEFRDTGLVIFINRILHVFGWCLAFDVDDNDRVVFVHPCRTKFRGFPKDVDAESYIRISKYLAENADDLLKDCED